MDCQGGIKVFRKFQDNKMLSGSIFHIFCSKQYNGKRSYRYLNNENSYSLPFNPNSDLSSERKKNREKRAHNVSFTFTVFYEFQIVIRPYPIVIKGRVYGTRSACTYVQSDLSPQYLLLYH